MSKVNNYLDKEGFLAITPRTRCKIEGLRDSYALVVKHKNKNRLAFRWDDTCYTDEIFNCNPENNVYKSVSEVINKILDEATKELGLAYNEVTITVFGGQPSSKNTKQAMKYYRKVASVANKTIEFGNGFHAMSDYETQDIVVSQDDITVTPEPAYESSDDSELSSDYSGNSTTVPFSEEELNPKPVVFSTTPSPASPPPASPELSSDDEPDAPAASAAAPVRR